MAAVRAGGWPFLDKRLFASGESSQRAAGMPARVLFASQSLVRLKGDRKRTQDIYLGEDTGPGDQIEFTTFVLDPGVQQHVSNLSQR